MADIFISYSSEDRGRITPIVKALEGRGWTVWWDRTIPPGKSFDQIIEEAITAAKCVIVLWSKKSVKSGWVKEEATKGKERQILVPALIDSIEPPFGFGLIQAANLTDWKGESSHAGFQLLIGALTDLLGSSKKAQEEIPKAKDKKKWLMICFLIAFVILLLAGGTSPWWWAKLLPPERPIGPTDGPQPRSVTKEPPPLVVPSKPEPVVPSPSVSPQQIPISPEPPPLPAPSEEKSLTTSAIITATNTSHYIAGNTWEWTIFINAPPELLSKIECVQYTLHSTFRLPPQKICTEYNQFAFTATGWGTFKIPILVMFKDGRTMELVHKLEFR